jgi:hypothetical protein
MGLETIHTTAEQKFITNTSSEQRSAPRHDIGADIQYLMLDMDLPEQGRLYDLSQSGALISIRRKVAIGTRLLFKILPDRPDQRAIGVIATVIREATGINGGTLYGCEIERINDLN